MHFVLLECGGQELSRQRSGVGDVVLEYDACACSPLGKLKRVSQPYANVSQRVWTTYTYDGSGRTLTVTAPDGSVTSYQYTGATTKTTDAAGKWKQFTNDAMGNLVVFSLWSRA